MVLVVLSAMLIDALHAALENAEITLNRVGVNRWDFRIDIFACAVIGRTMCLDVFVCGQIDAAFVGHQNGFLSNICLDDGHDGFRANIINNHSAGLAIAVRLAALDKGNAEWQRDLFISHAKFAQFNEASGDVAGAVHEFEAGEAILIALLARVGDHPGFVRDLAIVRGEIARLRGA